MKFILPLSFVSLALAAPSLPDVNGIPSPRSAAEQQWSSRFTCAGLQGVPLCCSTNLLGLVGLDCST
ncbi:hypothetical protein E4U54_005642, partial [Claviceps lovelessii]